MHEDQRQQAMKQANAPLPHSPQNNSAGADIYASKILISSDLFKALISWAENNERPTSKK